MQVRPQIVHVHEERVSHSLLKQYVHATILYLFVQELNRPQLRNVKFVLFVSTVLFHVRKVDSSNTIHATPEEAHFLLV